MDILKRIIADKRKEVACKKTVVPIRQLEQAVLFERTPHSLANQLRQSTTGIIAEYKRRSPSKAIINQDLNVQDVAQAYEQAGACGMSILTDGKYFGGSLNDLLLARASCQLPLLRKEFIIDPYQIIEAKAHGADLILLIAAAISRTEIKQLSELAQSLGLEVLLEVHNEAELQRSIMPSLDLLGINNRNLKTFEVDLSTSESLSAQIPTDFVSVSESGIRTPNDIKRLRRVGYQGFLIGEQLMTTNAPKQAASALIQAL